MGADEAIQKPCRSVQSAQPLSALHLGTELHRFWTDLNASISRDEQSQLPSLFAFPHGKELACYSHKDLLTQPTRAFSNI